jgi:hypothetical protein
MLCDYGLYLEWEGRSEVSVTVKVMTEEEVIRLHWVGREKETADGDVEEVFWALKNGWSGVSTFGMTIAGDEAGDVVFDEALIEAGEQTMEVLIGPAFLAWEKAHEVE